MADFPIRQLGYGTFAHQCTQGSKSQGIVRLPSRRSNVLLGVRELVVVMLCWMTGHSLAGELIAHRASDGRETGRFEMVSMSPWHALLAPSGNSIFAAGKQLGVVPLEQLVLPADFDVLASADSMVMRWPRQWLPDGAEWTLGGYRLRVNLYFGERELGPGFLVDPFEHNAILNTNPQGVAHRHDILWDLSDFYLFAVMPLSDGYKKAFAELRRQEAQGVVWLSIRLDNEQGFFFADVEFNRPSNSNLPQGWIIQADGTPLNAQLQVSVSFGKVADFTAEWFRELEILDPLHGNSSPYPEFNPATNLPEVGIPTGLHAPPSSALMTPLPENALGSAFGPISREKPSTGNVRSETRVEQVSAQPVDDSRDAFADSRVIQPIPSRDARKSKKTLVRTNPRSTSPLEPAVEGNRIPSISSKRTHRRRVEE